MDSADLEAARQVRHLAFHGQRAQPGQADRDAYDDHFTHVLIEDGTQVVGTFRFQVLVPKALDRAYAAQTHDLTPLRAYPAPMMELGRFCLDPERGEPDILRVAWAGIAAEVDARGVGLLFGCSSFPGADPAHHAEALALLGARHAGRAPWRPGVRAGVEAVPLPTMRPRDPARAVKALPPLLRTYLGMGGWVGTHAVIDRHLDTLHVFTGVEVASIPPARKRLLRAMRPAALLDAEPVRG